MTGHRLSRRLPLALLGAGLSCAPMEWQGSDFVPAAPSQKIVVSFTKSLDGSHTPEGHIYADLDRAEGADLCVFLWQDSTWTLSGRKADEQGSYSIDIAAGSIGPKGELEGFPENVLSETRAVWKGGAVTVYIEGEYVPPAGGVLVKKPK